ncbi:MAG: biopolymer transporter ExbD [Opitutales bacterium]|nr:biopolymer transporter ExbD [Opitutales bacterium]
MQLDIETPDFKSSGADLTPLIDVIFQLLVFFMLTSSFLIPHLELVLPSTNSEADKDERPQLVLSIDNSGSMFINGQPVSKEGLEAAIRSAAADSGSEILFLHADKSVTYERIIEAISSGKNAGMKAIELLHEK